VRTSAAGGNEILLRQIFYAVLQQMLAARRYCILASSGAETPEHLFYLVLNGGQLPFTDSIFRLSFPFEHPPVR
jgi:hypothetical protein